VPENSDPEHRDPPHHAAVPLQRISNSTYARLQAMTAEENYAARLIMDPECYADFFTESPTVRFNEYVGPHEDPATMVRASRMAAIDRDGLLQAATKPYCEIFADFPHNGPAFYEKCKPNPKLQATVGGSDGEADFSDSVSERVTMLMTSRVYTAFLRLQSETDTR
jgi:hypothetical protein